MILKNSVQARPGFNYNLSITITVSITISLEAFGQLQQGYNYMTFKYNYIHMGFSECDYNNVIIVMISYI